MAQKKYVSLSRLSTFFDNLKNKFAAITHKHTISDITDYKVDIALSSTSTNPVQNKVIDAEFEAVSNAMGALEAAIDSKAADEHNHDGRYYTETEIDTKISTINTSINNITNGSTTVAKAEEATHASSANSATTATTATKLGSSTVGSSTQPIYLNSGTATKVPYVGTAYGGTGATTVAGARTNLEVYSKSEVDSALSERASASHDHDTEYDAKGSAAGVQENLDAVGETLDSHIDNSDKHVTTSDKSNWNEAYEHTQAPHAPSNAQPNQNAFSNIAVGSATNPTIIAADSATDTITLVAGSNVTIAPDVANNKITIAATNTTYSAAGSSLGLVKSGGDVTISNGEITVNDDSHNHTIANIDGLQGSLDEKQDTITGGATTIVTSNLTASRALVSNGSGKVAVSGITSTELGYLDGVTSNVQEQLDGINEDVGGSIKDLSVSGKVITYTKNDGSTGTITTQDTDTNTKVTNTLNTTAKAYITGTTSSSTNTGTQVFDTGVYLDTTAGQLVATTFKGALDGNAKTATSATSAASATKATKDASGNTITSTYETKDDASLKLDTAKQYTDGKIAELINGAPSTLDTLGEIATAMEENPDVVTALRDAIGTKSVAGHTHTVSHTPAGTVSKPTFSGTKATISTSYTPAGSVSKPTFTGSAVTSGAPSGTGATATVASSTHTHEYTPVGSVSKPTFTGSAVTSGEASGATTVYSITAVGSLPSLSTSVTNRCLTLTFGAGSLPTKGSGVSVATGAHTHSVTAAGSVSQPTFTGTEASTTSISGTASVAGSGHTHSVTAAGSVSQPTFTGTAATISTEYTPAGSVSQPTFTGTAASLTTSADK